MRELETTRLREVIRKLGQGGMGTVYQVRHVSLDKFFALKLLPNHLADNPDLVARFQREARVMARLKHEHIVKVSDFTRDRDLCYLLEEFIDGQHLGQYLKARGALPAPDALRIAWIGRLGHQTGRNILAVSQNQQGALDGINGHGVFTAVVLDGIKGKADTDNNGKVDVLELFRYAESHVEEEARKIGPNRNPDATFYFGGSDFFNLSAPGAHR